MRLTYLYDSALVYFPTSFKLWKAYLQMQCLYVLGKGVKPKRASGRKKLAEMKEALEEEALEDEKYGGGLDGFVGWQEWKSLVATFERALMCLPNVRLFKKKISYRGERDFLTRFVSTDALTMAHVPRYIFAFPFRTHKPHTRTPNT